MGQNGKLHCVERVFEYKGFPCVVVLHDTGHRCGYVGVPKGHKYYGVSYDDMDSYADAPYGFTYSHKSGAYPIKTSNDIWWHGWDLAHYGCANDYDAVLKKIPQMRKYVEIARNYSKGLCDGHIYTEEEVAEQCKNVAEQFSEVMNG